MKNEWDKLGSATFGTIKKPEKTVKIPVATKSGKRRTVACMELSKGYMYRRAFSESSLLDACEKFDFKDGMSYHFLTGGDVDSMTYLKSILRQQNLEYVLFSTWCMAAEDILQLEQWIEQGKIKKMDAYVGEIFPGTYIVENRMLRDLFEKYQCGRMCVLRNHSKIFAGYGEKFYFTVETSANINTNPRIENGCITIDKGLFEFEKEFFDSLISFDKDDREKQKQKEILQADDETA